MTVKQSVLCLVALIALVGAGAIVWRFGFYVAPFAWTGEPARLASVLGIRAGSHVADIGAGSGALAVAMAEFAGSSGLIYATELSPERRADIVQRIGRTPARTVRVVEASAVETGLPEACCDAVYMRAVFHHIDDGKVFAANVARALRPGGRVAVIDFAPGTLWFHGGDHGVRSGTVVSAFQSAGLRVRQQVDDWGGGMFLVVFEQ